VVDSLQFNSSDESVELEELSLDLQTTNLEMNRSLSVSSIESSSRGEEGGGDQQMSPKLLNKAFSTKSKQYVR
jgi:hypothetical protein